MKSSIKINTQDVTIPLNLTSYSNHINFHHRTKKSPNITHHKIYLNQLPFFPQMKSPSPPNDAAVTASGRHIDTDDKSGAAGVPFSWELIPGLPKLQIRTKPISFSNNPISLPPPPVPLEKIRRKSTGTGEVFRRDPFLAALMKCSGEDDKNAEKGRRRSSGENGFGLWKVILNDYSCKRSCAVVDSVGFVVPSRRRIVYDAIKKSSG
ncbi:hypothetical protein Droror1_Dr00027862 [Drosera rotundifolia]